MTSTTIKILPEARMNLQGAAWKRKVDNMPLIM
jgi:hypothetical protein